LKLIVMKNFFTFLLVAFALGARAQNYNYTGNSEIVFIEQTGQPFYLIINGVAQNSIPSHQLKIVGVPATYHEIKMIYNNGSGLIVKQDVTIQPFQQYTAYITWRKGMKHFEWIEIKEVNKSFYGVSFERIPFKPVY